MNTGVMHIIDGVNVFVTDCAVETKRMFPESKNRSKRIRKKLIKRFGCETKSIPAVFSGPLGLLMHPDIKDKLDRQSDVHKDEVEIDD